MKENVKKNHKKCVKKNYDKITIYTPSTEIREKMKAYAEKNGMSLRAYLIELLFEKPEPAKLYPLERKDRSLKTSQVYMEKGHTYLFLCPKGYKEDLADKAKKSNMSLSAYILARFNTELIQKEMMMLDEYSRYIIFYQESGREKYMSFKNKSDAEEQTKKLKEKIGIEDTWLVDCVSKKRYLITDDKSNIVWQQVEE